MAKVILDDDFMKKAELIVSAIDRRIIDEGDDFFSSSIDGIERPQGGETLIQRNWQGRPYVYPINENGDPIITGKSNNTYTRVTTFIDKIDDKTNIHHWEMREMLYFLSSPDGDSFLLEVASCNPESSDFRARMKDLCKRILDRAGTSDTARKGTALHAITEMDDQGIDTSGIPTRYRPHLEAYRRFVDKFEMVEIEKFVVNDHYLTGGTPDRVIRYKPCEICGSELYIEDLKTGRVDNYTQLSISMQLALYAHSRKYDIATGVRSDLPPICLHKGVVVHLPAASTDPYVDGGLRWADIGRGWKYVDLCSQVIEARKEKNLVIPLIGTSFR